MYFHGSYDIKKTLGEAARGSETMQLFFAFVDASKLFKYDLVDII
jgi:hypothetical protein